MLFRQKERHNAETGAAYAARGRECCEFTGLVPIELGGAVRRGECRDRLQATDEYLAGMRSAAVKFREGGTVE